MGKLVMIFIEDHTWKCTPCSTMTIMASEKKCAYSIERKGWTQL
jgi:hypothetical protein